MNTQYSLPAPSVVLMGEVGTGKTTAIHTFLDIGVTPFVLFTDPGMGVLGKWEQEHGGPSKGCLIHWRYIPPYNPDWATMASNAQKINTLSFKALTDMPDMDKRKYSQFIDVFGCLANFTCDRCGQEFGPVDAWETDRAIIIDNMSGLSKLAMDMVAGGKPVKSMANWGVAMDQLENFSLKFSTGIRAWSVLIAHMEMEVDEITGTTRLMMSTLGRKLSPKLPRTYDEVIECYRTGDEFWWRSASTKAATKSRYLTLGDKLPPSFVPIAEAWVAAGGAAAEVHHVQV